MGAKVKGAGTDTIEIEGVKKLGGVEFTPIPDRIVAGTYLIAAAMTQGELLLTNCIPRHIESLTDKLKNTTKIITYDNGIYIRSDSRPQSVPIIETMPYPSFPTDLQAQMLALQTISEGSSMVVENIFETRFKHIAELTKMGADIVVKGKIALLRKRDSARFERRGRSRFGCACRRRQDGNRRDTAHTTRILRS